MKQEVFITKNNEDEFILRFIRKLIKAVEEGSADTENLEWLSWAKSKEDRYDPTIAAEDEFFGKRQHT